MEKRHGAHLRDRQRSGLLADPEGDELEKSSESSDPMKSRYKKHISGEYNFGVEQTLPDKVQENMRDEGKAPALIEVEYERDEPSGPDEIIEANKYQEMIINGEDRKIRNKVERGEQPTGFGERVQMEAFRDRQKAVGEGTYQPIPEKQQRSDVEELEQKLEQYINLSNQLHEKGGLSEEEAKEIEETISYLEQMIAAKKGVPAGKPSISGGKSE